MKIKILLVVGYFAPSFHGGISRTIQNLLAETSHEFDFEIITRDRDHKKDKPFNKIKSNQWNKVNNSMVYYAEESTLNLKNILAIINQKHYNIIHLNSMFDIFSIKFLILNRLKKIKNCKIILSPRGEFGEASFRIRKLKKIVYLILMKNLGFFNNIVWHASTILEEKEIKGFFKKKKFQCLIANDISTKVNVNINYSNKYDPKINIVFLSSISPEKNLSYALNILKEVKRELKFDIYGPIMDQEYWAECQSIIKILPKNIQVTYLGFIAEKNVLNVLSKYDLLFLPTGGENFGHVISEALSVGTKVLISDKTQWKKLHESKLGWDLSLNQMEQFIDIIENVDQKFLSCNEVVRMEVIDNFHLYYSKPNVINDNIKLYNGIN